MLSEVIHREINSLKFDKGGTLNLIKVRPLKNKNV